MHKSASAALMAMLFSLTQVAYSKTYKVRKGETLSQIAAREVSRPVYGKNGSLQKVLQLNPKIVNPNSIQVDATIVLEEEMPQVEPKADIAEVQEVNKVEESGDALAAAPKELVSESSWEFGASIIFSATELEAEAKDNSFKASPFSRINKGLSLGGSYISGDNRFFSEIKFLKSDFDAADDGTLEGEEAILKAFKLGYSRKLSSKFSLYVDFATEQKYFVAQKAARTFELESVFIDSLGLGLEYELFRHEAWSSVIGAGATYLLSASGDLIKPENGYGAGLKLDLVYQSTEDLKLVGGLFYDLRSQDSNISTQTEDQTGLMIGIRYSL